MKSKAHKAKSGGSDPVAGAPTEELPERWSVQRKTELVLRVVRGESLEAVSRESQVPAHELRVVDINAPRALAPLPRAPVPRSSRPQPRTPQPAGAAGTAAAGPGRAAATS